jgi:hypothetical protein
MSSPPQFRAPSRVPRAHLEGRNPTVLRFSNGLNVGANLRVVSLTGGLLSLSQPVVQGSQVKMIFLTGSGAVLGGVEMLPPVSDRLQPFRFVSLAADDQRRLGAMVSQQSTESKSEQDWMEKLRVASEKSRAPRRWRSKVAGALGLIMTGLATAAYLMHSGLLK